MKGIYISTIRDESEIIFDLTKQYNLGFEIQGFIEPYTICDFEEKLKITKRKLLDIEQRSLHGPFVDLFTASRDPKIVRVVKKRFLDAYHTAVSLKARHLIFHAGYIPKAFFSEYWLKASTEFWIDFLKDIGDDIEIHVENVCEDDWAVIGELIKDVDNPIFSACLDIGHVNINSSKSLEEWIKGLNEDIKYVHLHNNHGIIDSHFGLCNGKINILKILELLEVYAPNAKWSLETKLEETEESILFLEKNGFIKR